MLPERHPAYRWREAQPGSCTERENLAGAKGKGASGDHREAESTDAPEGADWAYPARIPFIADADSGPLPGKAEVRAEKDRSWGYTGPSWRRSKPTLIANKRHSPHHVCGDNLPRFDAGGGSDPLHQKSKFALKVDLRLYCGPSHGPFDAPGLRPIISLTKNGRK